MYRPCVVVPHYNHVPTVLKLLEQLAEYALPCILVDDGSDAETRKTLATVVHQYDWLKIVWRPKNCGKGAAMLAGFKQAHAEGFTHLLQIDADLQHTVADIQKLLDSSARNPESCIVVYPIYSSSVPKSRLIARYITHFWVWVETLSFHIKDSMCGFRVYPIASCISLFEKNKLGKRMDFDIEILVRLYWQGVAIQQLPSPVVYPEDGVSHFNYWRDNWLISKCHTRLVFGMLWRCPQLLARNFRKKQCTNDEYRDGKSWFAMRERGSIWGMQFIFWVYRALGTQIAKLFLFPVVGYFFITGGAARLASKRYLKRISSLLPKQISLSGFKHFQQFAYSLLDKIDVWSGNISHGDVILNNPSLFERVAEDSRGVVILSAHLGNLEVCRYLSDKVPGLKINALMMAKHSPKFFQLLKNVNPDIAESLVSVNEIDMSTAVILKDKIDAGEQIVLMGDRFPPASKTRSNKSVTTSFLGKDADFPQGPFVLAGLMRCPVYLMFCLKVDNYHHIYLEHFANSLHFSSKVREKELQKTIEQYALRLQHYCLKAPLQWFNFYDFWRK